MRFLLFSLCCTILLSGCGSAYDSLRRSSPQAGCEAKIKPAPLADSRYQASVDVIGKHLSGILLVKNMPDSSYRMVFTNEAGFKFFDFEFGKDNSFKAHYVIDQMDKKAVVNTLRLDFSLLLGLPFQKASQQSWETDNEQFYGFPYEGSTAYLVSDKNCNILQRIELGSKRKRKVSLEFGAGESGSIQIRHHTFDMKILLSPLKRD